MAKQIIEENDFREKILSAEKSLDFINEIDYATGLERNNVEILNVVYKKTNQIFKEFESEFFHVDLNLFDSLNLELEDAPEQIVDAKKLLKSIKKAKDFASKKDEDFDNIVDEDDDEAEKKELKKFSNKIEKGIMANLFLNLLLLSTVIKNSELIDYSIRKPILDDCFEYWGKFFIIQMIILSEEFKNSEQIKTHVKKKSEEIMPEVSDKVNEALENEKNKEQIDSLNRNIKYFGAIMVEKTFFDFTGTLNLEFYLKEKIKNSNNSPSVIKLLSIFLYGELRLPRFMDLLKDYLKNITKSNRGFMMLIYHNIYNYYISRTKLDESQKKELEKIIVETYLSANRISTNRKGATIDTSKLYDQIRKDRIRTDLSNLI